MKRFILVFTILCLGLIGNSQDLSFCRKHRESGERYIIKVLKELNLTPQQEKYIMNILRESRSKIKGIEREIFEIRRKNREILMNYPPDKNEFLANQEKISDLLKQVHLIRAKGYIDIVLVLDAEQYKIFTEKMNLLFRPPYNEE